MPVTKLKVVECPPNVVDAQNDKQGLRFLGQGDADYQCGHCGAIVMRGMDALPNVTPKVIRCNKCGTCNEIPAHPALTISLSERAFAGTGMPDRRGWIDSNVVPRGICEL